MTGGKKRVHFFGKGCCEKCAGVKQQRKRRLKNTPKVRMPITFVKKRLFLIRVESICIVIPFHPAHI